MNMEENKKFSLWDIIAAVVVIISMSTLAVPRIAMSLPDYKINKCHSNIIILNAKIDQLKEHTGMWAKSVDELSKNLHSYEDLPVCPYGDDYVIGPDHHIIEHDH